MSSEQLLENLRSFRKKKDKRRDQIIRNLGRRKLEIDRYVLFSNIGGIGLSLPILTTYLLSDPRNLAIASFISLFLFGFGAYMSMNGLSNRFVCATIYAIQNEGDVETKNKLIGFAWIGGGDKPLSDKHEFHANAAFWSETIAYGALILGATVLTMGLALAVFRVGT